MTWPVLPRPQFVDVEQRDLIAQSDWRAGILIGRRLDAATPKVWTLRWPAARPAVAIAVREHAKRYLAGKEFDWTPPGGSPVTVVYDEPSVSIDALSGRLWSIRLRLREAMVKQSA